MNELIEEQRELDQEIGQDLIGNGRPGLEKTKNYMMPKAIIGFKSAVGVGIFQRIKGLFNRKKSPGMQKL